MFERSSASFSLSPSSSSLTDTRIRFVNLPYERLHKVIISILCSWLLCFPAGRRHQVVAKYLPFTASLSGTFGFFPADYLTFGFKPSWLNILSISSLVRSAFDLIITLEATYVIKTEEARRLQREAVDALPVFYQFGCVNTCLINECLSN